MCVGGPPNPMQPIRPHCTSTSRSPTLGRSADESAAATRANYNGHQHPLILPSWGAATSTGLTAALRMSR